MPKELNLKLGNLVLAIWLSTVPTAITYGMLGLHGMSVCNNLAQAYDLKKEVPLKKLCHEASWQTTRSYILLIGFFITLPTWFWFYISVKNKSTRLRDQRRNV